MNTRQIPVKTFLYIIAGMVSAGAPCLNAQDSAIDENIVEMLPSVFITPRETAGVYDLPTAVTTYNALQIEQSGIGQLHDFTAETPNFYAPAYGSKITSTLYIRGVGGRTDQPGIGLYVDDVPMMEKSAYDFAYADLANITLLRGPQGTLYGRNAIGGLLRLNTLSPFNAPRAEASVTAGNHGVQDYRARVARQVSDRAGLTLSGFYTADKGFFRNEVRGERDASHTGGGRMKWEFRPSAHWRMTASAGYEHVRQNAYPYKEYDPETRHTLRAVGYDAPGRYERDLATGGMVWQRQDSLTVLTLATGGHFLNDDMEMDMDFTPEAIFGMHQHQRAYGLTEEITLRSNHSRPYQWTCGVFGFGKSMRVSCPTILYATGFRTLVPSLPPFVSIDRDIRIPGTFDMPSWGAAAYHESSYTLMGRLTLTLGLRLDYERIAMDYDSEATLHATAAMPSIPQPISIRPRYYISGSEHHNNWEVLPKAAVRYALDERNMIYASVAKGYKAGGYNYTMFANDLQLALQGAMRATAEDNEITPGSVRYKPEMSWNYEVGAHLSPVRNKLYVNFSAFAIKFSDQQIVSYLENGSRKVSNAARSLNTGVEFDLRYRPVEGLTLGAAYGYTHAEFKRYDNGRTSYKGNAVPFVPAHTMAVDATYALRCEGLRWLDEVVWTARYQGIGRVAFNEANTARQKYYGQLSGHVEFTRRRGTVGFWMKNAANERAYTFYCESLGKAYVQQAHPMTLGVTLRYRIQ